MLYLNQLLNKMKGYTFILTLLFVFGSILCSAQKPTILVDKTEGCDKIDVHFSFAPIVPVPTTVEWNIYGANVTALPSFTGTDLTPGVYNILLTINGSATDTAHKVIRVGKTPKADFTFKEESGYGVKSYRLSGSVSDTLSAISSYQFAWSLPNNVSQNSRSFFHDFGAAGDYTVRLIVKDEVGCADTASHIVQVADSFAVPNVFTPNGDGVNDFFEIKSDGSSVITFRAFSRSGTLVFETEGKIIRWDGRLNSGDDVVAGLYFYTIESKGKSSKKQKGFFYIFR